MVEEKYYLVRVNLFESEGNTIILTQNLDFESIWDSKYIEVVT